MNPDRESGLLTKKYLAFTLGLFVVGSFAGYFNIINTYFNSDDLVVLARLIGKEFPVTWASSQGGFFRPLFTLSFFIDYRIWGLNSAGFHLTNVIIHSLTAFLVFLLSLRIGKWLNLSARTTVAMSLAAGALFLLHPSHTEVVSWIAGRADGIATPLCLTSLILIIDYLRNHRQVQLFLALLTFGLALLAKESVICLPVIVGVIGIYSGHLAKHSKTRRHFLTVLLLYASILLIFLAIRYVFIGSMVGGYGASQHLNFSPEWLVSRLLEASVRSVLPPLPVHWSFFLLKPLKSRLFIAIALIAVGLIATAIVFRRRQYDAGVRKLQNRFLLMLAAMFWISLLPVINLRLSLYHALGERFLYLPSVFSCLLIASTLTILFRNRTVWLAILICVLGFYSWRLYDSNGIWREASQLSLSIVNDLTSTATHGRLVVLNAPDTLRGVPVFHNGLPEALQFFQSQTRIDQVEIVAFQTLQSRWDEIQLRESGDALILQPANRMDTFARAVSSECLELIAQSEDHLLVRPRPCILTTDAYYFSGGKMRRLLER